MKNILIVGGGFAGINAAKVLGKSKQVRVTLIDRRNHHLFQPLLYQVAMAALSPAEIAAPEELLILSAYLRIFRESSCTLPSQAQISRFWCSMPSEWNLIDLK